MNTVTGRKILIVDDDDKIRTELSDHFGQRGNYVSTARNLASATELIQTNVFDAIVLDLILPDGEGLELFSMHSSLPPVVILSSLGSDADLLYGFSAGACDYVVKPCSPEVLEARIALRLLPKHDATVSRHGLTIDTNERRTVYDGKQIQLTGSEFNILYFLMTHAGVFYNATQIYENVWHAPGLKTTSIKYHISNMRQKLLQTTGKQLILTCFGKGYAFVSGGEK